MPAARKSSPSPCAAPISPARAIPSPTSSISLTRRNTSLLPNTSGAMQRRRSRPPRPPGRRRRAPQLDQAGNPSRPALSPARPGGNPRRRRNPRQGRLRRPPLHQRRPRPGQAIAGCRRRHRHAARLAHRLQPRPGHPRTTPHHHRTSRRARRGGCRHRRAQPCRRSHGNGRRRRPRQHRHRRLQRSLPHGPRLQAAVQAGRDAYETGLPAPQTAASPTSPLTAFLAKMYRAMKSRLLDRANASSQHHRRARLPLSRVRQLLSAASRARVTVLGDVMLDQFLWGTSPAFPPKRPFPSWNLSAKVSSPAARAMSPATSPTCAPPPNCSASPGTTTPPAGSTICSPDGVGCSGLLLLLQPRHQHQDPHRRPSPASRPGGPRNARRH